MKGRKSTANLDEVKLKALERESAADKALLESLLLRYADASARQDLSTQPGMARIIQQAAVPTSPSFPKSGPLCCLDHTGRIGTFTWAFVSGGDHGSGKQVRHAGYATAASRTK